MVTVDFYQKLARLLELYFLQQLDFKLPHEGYDLILLMPISSYSFDEKRTLVVSAKSLDKAAKRAATHGLLTILQQGLSEEEYTSIYNLDILDSSEHMVRQSVARFPKARWVEESVELPISFIGGVTNQTVTLVTSGVLSLLRPDANLTVHLADGKPITGILSRKIHRLDLDAELSFTTGNGPVTCCFSDIVRVEEQLSF